MAQRRAARMKKLQEEEENKAKQLEGVSQEIQLLKGLAEPPKVDPELFKQIQEPQLTVIDEEDENEKEEEKINLELDEKFETPNLEQDERKKKREDLQKRIDAELDLESKKLLLKQLNQFNDDW